MSHSPSPLQIATKIHFFLLRQTGQGIDVARMLKHSQYARGVLAACDNCAGTELAELAVQFRRVRSLYRRLDRLEADQALASARSAPWQDPNTDFGASRPLTDAMPSAPAPLADGLAPPVAAEPGRQRWLARWLPGHGQS